jgi:hypothetical protein
LNGRIGDQEWEQLGLRAYALLGLADHAQHGPQSGSVLESLWALDLTGFDPITIAETVFARSRMGGEDGPPAVLLAWGPWPENPVLQRWLER